MFNEVLMGPALRLGPISGWELRELTTHDYMGHLVREGYVCDEAADAVRRLVTIDGGPPATDGRNVPAVTHMRRLLGEYAALCTANAFAVTAPHTHWEPNQLIVISEVEGQYRIGPETLRANETYWPVSFCFTPQGACAYEWIDSSVAVDRSELSTAYRMVRTIAPFAPEIGPTVGLSLNFRYKRLLSESIVPTNEAPPDFATPSDASVITRLRSSTVPAKSGSEQVGWLAFDEPSWAADDHLSALQLDARKQMAALLANASPEALEAILELASRVADSTDRAYA